MESLYFSGFQHCVNGLFQNADSLCQSYAFHLAGCGIHMTAAAHALHDNLYIDFINRSGTDIDLTLIIGKYKTRLNSLNIQQFIGRLRADNGRTRQILGRT